MGCYLPAGERSPLSALSAASVGRSVSTARHSFPIHRDARADLTHNQAGWQGPVGGLTMTGSITTIMGD